MNLDLVNNEESIGRFFLYFNFLSGIKTQFGTSVCAFCCNNACEYLFNRS